MLKYTKKSHNTIKDEFEAVKKLSDDISMEDMAGVIFFCSSNYDLNKIQQAINDNFSCEVIGCTTAGEVTDSYQTGGIVGVGFSSSMFAFHSKLIEKESEFTSQEAERIVNELSNELTFSTTLDASNMFAFLLNDGMAAQEEKVTSLLYNALDGIALFGGSAGDDYKFKDAPVFVDGAFHHGGGVLTLIETKLKFKIYKIQHYTGSDKDMVVTHADPSKRVVYEINGSTAATELADVIGIVEDELAMKIYSTNPLMLQIGNEWYVRSIQQVFEDGSIAFACAIDDGIPLTVGRITGLVQSLQDNVEQIKNDFENIELTIGCECVHRRLEIEETGLKEEVEPLLKDINFIGFATYGEQFNSVHVNQTLTCVVLGE